MEKETLTKIPEGERQIMEVFWENVEDYRVKRRMTVSKLCGLVGYSENAYFRAKKRKSSINGTVMQSLAWALGVKTLDLFEDWS